MAESAFEGRLRRLYAEAPVLPDPDRFNAAVLGRLERSWRLRRLLIGSAGLAGGVLAAREVVGAGLIQRAGAASQAADLRVQDTAADLWARAQASTGVHVALVNGEALWMVAGLVALGVALVAARVLDG